MTNVIQFWSLIIIGTICFVNRFCASRKVGIGGGWWVLPPRLHRMMDVATCCTKSLGQPVYATSLLLYSECRKHSSHFIGAQFLASEQPEARCAGLDTECEHIHELRARKQPEAWQARPNRQREHDHKHRAIEQPETRQSRLERLCERNHQQ